VRGVPRPDGNSTVAGQSDPRRPARRLHRRQLANFKSGARPSPIMQGMAAALSPEDMANVGAYYETQKPAAGEMARDKARVTRGQQIWRTGNKALGSPPARAATAPRPRHPGAIPAPRRPAPGLTLGWLQAYASGARPAR
jgi:hypothetical protein